MFPELLKTRRFASLFWCQFLSALNDNFVKNALVILILFKIGEAEGASLVALAGAVLVAPFFFLSGLGGEWADKYDKAELAEWLKRFEIPIAIVAAAGFWFNSVPVLFAALAGFGVMAALFGPIKYGILPNILDKTEISAGNALVESATFAAILIGTIAGGLMVHPDGTAWELPAAVVVLSVLCWVAARFIPKTGAAAPDLVVSKNPLTSTYALIDALREDSRLWTGGLITSWFWLVGAVALSLLPVMLKDGMNGTQGVITLGLLVFTVGIAVGSLLAAKASKMRPNMALVPVGAFLMAVACLELAWTASGLVRSAETLGVEGFLASFTGLRLATGLFVLSLAGGLFIVPSFAAVQLWARDDHKARVVAACNVLSAAFMVGASLLLAALQWVGFGTASLFLMLGVANIVVLGLVLKAWGKHGLKDLAMFLFKTFLRLEIKGTENLPAAGTRAIIAPNHVSFLDAALMHSIMPDFASYRDRHRHCRALVGEAIPAACKVHPIDPTKPLSTRHLINDVKAGDTLVIFPEGRLTTTGGLMKVYDGTAMIADKADAVVVPVRIDGLERSQFGYLEPVSDEEGMVPEDDGDDPAAGEATGGPDAARQAAASGCGRGAAGHHGQHGGADGEPRSDSVLGARRSEGYARYRQAGDRRRARHEAFLQEADPRRASAGCKDCAAGTGGRGCRRDSAECGRRCGNVLCAAVDRARGGDAQLHGRRAEHDLRLPGGEGGRGSDVTRVRREGEARRGGR